MSLLRFHLTLLLVIAFLAPLTADKPRPDAVVVPLVSLRGKLPLRDALADVQRQSGVPLSDGFGKAPPDTSLDLDKLALEKTSFWRAIDALAVASNAKPIQSGRDGSVRLQPMTEDDRRPPLSYDGPFRTRVTRIAVSREFDSDRASCVVGLEVTWTPTLRPLYLEAQPQQLTLRDGNGKAVNVSDEGSSLAPVDGRFNFAFETNLPPLPRDHKRITSLEGRLLAIAPTRMIRFSFEKSNLSVLDSADVGGEVRKESRDGIVCQFSKIVLGRDVWTVQISLDYPEGNRKLESFQAASLVANNELVLTSQDGKRKLLPSGSVIDQVGSRRAVVTYNFTDAKGAPRGKAADWKVAYVAPARIVEIPFRFSFENLRLP